MGIKSFYDVRPDELEPGDVLVATVTLHVGYPLDDEGKPHFRVYRCTYPPQLGHEDVPQGSRVSAKHAKAIAEGLFPVVGYAGLKADIL
jgi:hypothetical protein